MSDRYRKLGVWIWTDFRLEDLPKPAPNPHYLYQYLLTGPNAMALPGATRIGEAGLAEQLGWSIEDFRSCFAVLAEKGLVHADWEKRVIYTPDAFRDNKPVSRSVVTAWRKSFNELPNCQLKIDIYLKAVNVLEGTNDLFLKEFVDHLDPGFMKPGGGEPPKEEVRTAASGSGSAAGCDSDSAAGCDAGRPAGSVSPETGQETEKGKELKQAPADARRAPFKAFVGSEFHKIRGFDLITDGTDWAHFESLLAKSRDKPEFSFEKLCEYWVRFLRSPEEFHRKQGKPLRFFCANINAFMGEEHGTNRGRNGNGSRVERFTGPVYVREG